MAFGNHYVQTEMIGRSYDQDYSRQIPRLPEAFLQVRFGQVFFMNGFPNGRLYKSACYTFPSSVLSVAWEKIQRSGFSVLLDFGLDKTKNVKNDVFLGGISLDFHQTECETGRFYYIIEFVVAPEYSLEVYGKLVVKTQYLTALTKAMCRIFPLLRYVKTMLVGRMIYHELEGGFKIR